MQQKESFNAADLPDVAAVPGGRRILSIDPGTKRIGVAISDELRIVATPLPSIARSSWKRLLTDIRAIIAKFDAGALVVGLPLNTDGTESPMSADARDLARKFSLSLDIPVFLQDERVTSYEARKRLWDSGISVENTKGLVDSEAAAIILGDFLDRIQKLR